MTRVYKTSLPTRSFVYTYTNNVVPLLGSSTEISSLVGWPVAGHWQFTTSCHYDIELTPEQKDGVLVVPPLRELKRPSASHGIRYSIHSSLTPVFYPQSNESNLRLPFQPL
jgi:hypothetical protein